MLYYLVFHAEQRTLVLYRHDGQGFVRVEANDEGRLAIPELDLETALLDGWARFWYKGIRLLLSVEVVAELNELTKRHRIGKQISECYEKANQFWDQARQLEAQLEAMGTAPTP